MVQVATTTSGHAWAGGEVAKGLQMMMGRSKAKKASDQPVYRPVTNGRIMG